MKHTQGGQLVVLRNVSKEGEGVVEVLPRSQRRSQSTCILAWNVASATKQVETEDDKASGSGQAGGVDLQNNQQGGARKDACNC